MSGSRALLAVPAMVAVVLGLTGCRGAERVAPPAVPSASAAPSSHGSRAAAGSDPLVDVEATLDAIERDVDADAGSAPGTGR